MSDNRFALVEFQGSQLLTIFDGETVRVAMKPLVDALGIDWVSQYKRIQRDPLLSEGMVIMTMPSERGMQETVTLPIDLMHGWLFTLTVSKVREDARARVIAYQRECYQVLHDYWVKGAAINPRHAQGGTTSTGDLLKLVDRLKSEWQPDIKAMLHAVLAQTCERMNVPLPPIEAFGQPSLPDLEIAGTFFAGLMSLREAGITFDHHRQDEMLAISLPEIGKLFEKRRIDSARNHKLWRALRAHPAFMDVGVVNSRDGKSRHCWMFNRAKLPGLETAPAR
ncbi:phage antirepressor N-terminal domain-containing protein [Novosphingobium sp. EMRT-2]|uniref:phage antirepressor N-terminal domain-containing protein n=1 Tax=Novosphingobium sp. EMRT-2 TaxID=2571749 RepID=UPI0010BE0046|nr:phage antirepressor N-terminal domain-containing protein [Novosphingobium sp. EMRT-2]QCI92904.1 hypothetical protein FA702_04555 [Novosphingobium sp. EMRT-2]